MKNKSLIYAVIIIAIIAVLIVVARKKRVEQPTPKTGETQTEEKQVTEPEKIQAEPSAQQDTILQEVGTEIQTDASLENLEEDLNKLDLSGNDPDLQMEEELKQ
jgi:hypothetical protein